MGGFLETEGLTKQFGELTAVEDVSLSVAEGDVTAIIGPNGAGKTTLFNLLSGNYTPTTGKIRFRGERIDGDPPHDIYHAGIARSFQITNFFPELTAFENVRLATQSEETGFKPRDFLSHHSSLEGPRAEARAVLERLDLADIADEPAETLSHGQQRHLEIAIALGSDPDLLLMDEPTSGMSPDETRETMDLIEDIAEETSLLVIEHDMDVVMSVSDKIAVMNQGTLLTMDTPEAVQEDEQVQDVYLRGGQVA
ncbi:ABC transporter ATP-binding protein [Haloarchaeobius sp. HRN-SO-5]|uniref:ABC transporter ATP-binding protein n=1 Tax=Haloarchaeobius sp. HRN-SO-5 TaxID=3446118 RepID=UPI003EBFAB6A